jgi:hypothetical protein
MTSPSISESNKCRNWQVALAVQNRTNNQSGYTAKKGGDSKCITYPIRTSLYQYSSVFRSNDSRFVSFGTRAQPRQDSTMVAYDVAIIIPLYATILVSLYSIFHIYYSRCQALFLTVFVTVLSALMLLANDMAFEIINFYEGSGKWKES